MHSIELIRVTWQNLLMYGSNINEISLNNDGITWINGPNGSGKSTIIEAITVALFGESYRKVPQKELLNASNKGKMYIRLVFDRIDTNGRTRYAIKRELGRSGSMSMSLSILSDDERDENKPAGVSQKMFEDDILGFNRNLFENVISLNTIQTKSFIDMTAEEKRKLIEAIIALHIDKIKKMNSATANLAATRFNDATNDVIKFRNRIVELETVKQTLLAEQRDDISQIELDIQSNESMLNRILTELADVKSQESVIISDGTRLKATYDAFGDPEAILRQITEYRSLISSGDDTSAEIDRLTDVKARQMELLDEANANLKTFMEEFDSLERYPECNTVADLMNMKSTLNARLAYASMSSSKCDDDMAHIKAENDALVSGVPCPVCAKPSTEDDIEVIRKSLRLKWTESNKAKKGFDSEVKKCTKSIATISELIEVYTKTTAKIDGCKRDIKEIDSHIAETTKSINSIKSRIQSKVNRIDELRKLFGTSDIDSFESDVNRRVVEKKSVGDDLANLRTTISLNRNNQTILAKNRDIAIQAISALKARLEKRKQADAGSSLRLTDQQINKANDDLKTAQNNVLEYSDELEIIKFIDEMYGDEGIKKFVLGMYVPTLNQVIAHNISLFNLPFAIEFDDSLDYNFIGKFGMAQVYKGLSQGQQRKLNFCISMAFRDFVTLIADFKINIMFLDEVLDISTDDKGLRDMVNLIMQKNVADIPSIYLMSHRGADFEDEWRHVIEVSIDGMYSRAEQIR